MTEAANIHRESCTYRQVAMAAEEKPVQEFLDAVSRSTELWQALDVRVLAIRIKEEWHKFVDALLSLFELSPGCSGAQRFAGDQGRRLLAARAAGVGSAKDHKRS